MWTTKRMLLLLAGFALFFLAYLIYGFYLGGIDGLAPLASNFQPGGEQEPFDFNVARKSTVDQKLRDAFGDREDLRNARIKLEIGSRNLVLAARDFLIEPDGRVRLPGFNLAIFGKNTPEGQFPEINTVKSDVAFLTFDRPVTRADEMCNRKIVAGELSGNILIKSNRRTSADTDDLSLSTQGPMYFRDDEHLIWTMASVYIIDTQSKPEPTTVKAVGMDLHLTTESKAPVNPQAKPKKQSISGVESITLRANVVMHLFDTGSGFFGGAKQPATKVAAKDKGKGKEKVDDKSQPQEKARVVITTPGPFRYDVATDRARFDIPQKQGPLPEKVTVIRYAPKDEAHPETNGGSDSTPAGQVPPGQEKPEPVVAESKQDQLDCEHLELQFQHKADTPGVEKNEQGLDLAIQSAHATGRLVELDSAADHLHAIGNDFFYDAVTKESVLKGKPEMIALKEGHEIHTLELRIVNAGDKDTQQAQAKGAGYVALLDKATAKRSHYAYWNDSALFGKEGDYDCLTLFGKARFEDRDSGQRLGGDRLKVWLMPSDKEAAPAGSDTQKMRPHHLEATGHVTALSADMLIEPPTEHLMVWFRDLPPGTVIPKATPPAGPAAAGPAANPDQARQRAGTSSVAPTTPALTARSTPVATAATPGARDQAGAARPANSTAPAAPAARPGSPQPAAKKPPICVKSRNIEAFVVRSGEQNDLEKIRCQGDVEVHQAPDPNVPDDRGVEILGKTMQLDHTVDGNVLVVTGDLAKVQLNKITIFGLEVNIDQRTNRAWVPTRGIMVMQSSTKLSATQQEKPAATVQPKPEAKNQEKPTEITIHWNREMNFDGQYALFHGGVQAAQDGSTLLCMEMQVFLDRPVSLKEGDKSGAPPAKIKHVVCDSSVRMEERVFENSKFVRYSRLTAPVVDLNNEDGDVTAPGPGVVHMLQYGSSEEFGGATNDPNKPRTDPNKQPPTAGNLSGKPTDKPAEQQQELKLTRINYLDRLHANNGKRTATFYGSVEVVNLPSTDPDQVVDIDHPPPGCLYMRCEQLKVFTHKEPDGRSSQEMEAQRRVVVQSQEFWGTADKVKFEEAKDLVILEGGDGGMATLVREKVLGNAGDKLRGKKIFYWRRTNRFKIEGANVITSD